MKFTFWSRLLAIMTFRLSAASWALMGATGHGQELLVPTEHSSPATLLPGALDEAVRKESEEYYELLQVFADALDQIDRNYVKELSRRELIEAAIRGMLSKLDPYSNYIAPTEVDSFRGGVENEFGGVGLHVDIEGDALIVVSPIYGTPAYRARLSMGDQIESIDDQPVRNLAIDDAIKSLKGLPHTTVKLRVKKKSDGTVEEIELERELIRVQTVLGNQRKADDSPDYMLDRAARIGYVRISNFGRHTTEEFEVALQELSQAGIRALILDLRFNPGGLLSSAIQISDLFIKEGKIVSTAGRNTPERTVHAKAEGTYEDFPIAILVNRYSASASEIVAACLQDHRRAVVVGERTWGKGSVQNVIDLEGGKSALKLTTAGYRRPSGKNIDRATDALESDDWGVRPDENFEVKLSDGEMRAVLESQRRRDFVRRGATAVADEFVDRQLQKSLEYLRNRIADSP